MLEEKEYSFSVSHALPVVFFLLAFTGMSLNPSLFPIELQWSSFLLFAASCVWDFKGLFFACAVSCSFLLGICPRVFIEFSSFIFFLIAFNIGFITALLKKRWIESKRALQEEFIRLKAWESHYYVFRQEAMEELEKVKKVQEEMLYMDHQLQNLEKERLEECLKEDDSQKILMDLFIASQEKCQHLQEEVELLEEILLTASKVQEKPRVIRRKKIKDVALQRTLF